MGYWVEAGDGERVYNATIKDAYRTAAAILIGAYRRTNGNVHKVIKGYTGSTGIHIYNSARGKTYTHWVRFNNGSNPKDGYDAMYYNKNVGVGGTYGKKFPANW